MPKQKSNRGAAKRFKRTGTGRIARSKAYASHILTKKNSKRKMSLRQGDTVDKANLTSIKRLLPYL